MLKKKYVISISIILGLALTLFAGLAVGQNLGQHVNDPLTKKGYLSVPAAAFEPFDREQDYDHNHPFQVRAWEIYNGGYYLSHEHFGSKDFYAPVQLPDGVTVTQVNFYFSYYSDPLVDQKMEFYLLVNVGGLEGIMAHASSVVAGEYQVARDETIDFATIYNSQNIHYLKVEIAGPDPRLPIERHKFHYAIIEYEYSVPKYQDASIWINIDLLPGTRINVASQGEFEVSADETTHVWHGFDSDPWSTLTEDEQTEFLATAKWHFYVNDQEVPLTHIVRYDEVEDVVHSTYYRVFPPNYFELNRKNKLTGDWYWMENGVWGKLTREASLRVK